MAACVVVCAIVACAIFAASVSAAPVVIGHRGNSSIAPENTLASVSAAAGFAWGVETDPRVTQDGKFILMHDSSVDATTEYTGAVASYRYDELRAMDAGSWGSWNGGAFAGEPVGDMLEEMAAARSHGMVSCLDVKIDSTDLIETYAPLYVSALLPYKDSVEIHCFKWGFLEKVEELAPGQFTLVALGSNSDYGSVANALSLLPTGVDKLSWSAPSATDVAAAHAAGLQIYAWTPNSISDILKYRDRGVDGIVTDRPALATALVNPTPVPDDWSRPALHSGLMANWSFDDGLTNPTATAAADAVGGLDAALGPDVELPQQWLTNGSAKLGGALELDGSNDYAAVPISRATGPMTSAVTVSAWVKLDRLPSASPGAFQSILDSTQDAYNLYLDKGAQELRFKVTATGQSARPGIPQAALDTTAWHHVMGVYDGGSGVARIYLDGQLMDVHGNDDGTIGLQGMVGTQTMFLGSYNASDMSACFDGRIDDTAVWNRALSQEEVKYLYNGGAGRAVMASNILVPTAEPVVRLGFEGNLQNLGSGGSDYDGTIVNGVSGTNAYTAGPRGQALAFTNPQSTSGGDGAKTPYMLGNTGTIAFWCNPRGFSTLETVFDACSGTTKWKMSLSSDGLAKFLLNSDASVDYTLDESDHWYHMAVSWFRTNGNVLLDLYVDGVLRDISTGTWTDPGMWLYLAGGGGSKFGTISLDDFRIYDTMLTTDEIAAMFLGREVIGDANGDRVVNQADAAILAAHWLQSGDVGWSDGDFNRDGTINDLDASILAAHWLYGSGANVSVPEPNSLAGLLLSLATLAVVVRRRRGATEKSFY